MLLSPIDDPLPKQTAASSVTFSRFRAVLFNDLLDNNPTNRAHALDNIVQIVTEWARIVTDNNALANFSRPGSFSTNGNPTPPFSPAAHNNNSDSNNDAGTATSSIEGALASSNNMKRDQFSGDQNSEPMLPDQSSPHVAMEKLTISTNHSRPCPCPCTAASEDGKGQRDHQARSRQESSSMSASSPLAYSPSTSACHSASSSTSATENGACGAVDCAHILTSCSVPSSGYHFQNDPDIHFNRSLPDKLSPLEERVAEVDEAAR
ncbi:hypothetical protein BG004_001633, partial [Podila humilis]